MLSRAAIAILKVLSHLPFGVLYAFSGIVKFIIFDLLGYRKAVIVENLRKSFPEKPEREIRLIAREFALHLTDVIAEALKCRTLDPATLRSRFIFENPELIERYHSAGKNTVTLLGHYGNWEYAGAAYSLQTQNTANLIYKPLSNSAFNAFMLSIRSRFGGNLVSSRNTLRTLYAQRSQAVISNTAFIADQTPHKGKGIKVPFLNRDTPFFDGAEQLARRFDMPVLFARIVKEKRGHYRCTFELIEERPADSPPGMITREYAQKLEQSITSRPALWLWSHRRWKHVE